MRLFAKKTNEPLIWQLNSFCICTEGICMVVPISKITKNGPFWLYMTILASYIFFTLKKKEKWKSNHRNTCSQLVKKGENEMGFTLPLLIKFAIFAPSRSTKSRLYAFSATSNWTKTLIFESKRCILELHIPCRYIVAFFVK